MFASRKQWLNLISDRTKQNTFSLRQHNWWQYQLSLKITDQKQEFQHFIKQKYDGQTTKECNNYK